MPLDAKSSYVKDLRVDSDGNQVVPLLLSTKGRWVWCEDAFKYTVRDGVLTVETGPAPRKDGAKTRTVVIPDGTWTADDGTVVTGPTTVTVETPLDRLVYFTKK